MFIKSKFIFKYYTYSWDVKKAKTNFKKHGITFESATKIFKDDDIIYTYDLNHSKEKRIIFIGKIYNNVLFVVTTIRKYRCIRIISARLASRKERMIYERSKNEI